MKRLMDTLFRGIVTFFDKNIMIRLRTGGTNTQRDNKDFYIRVLNHGGEDGNNGLFVQKYMNNNFISSLAFFDWDKGNFTVYGGICLGAYTQPTPVKGGFYFNLTDNKWYKCIDGSNWEVANI